MLVGFPFAENSYCGLSSLGSEPEKQSPIAINFQCLKRFHFYEPYFQVVFTLELEKQSPKAINFECCKVSLQ
jgi:hypothetical protein